MSYKKHLQFKQSTKLQTYYCSKGLTCVEVIRRVLELEHGYNSNIVLGHDSVDDLVWGLVGGPILLCRFHYLSSQLVKLYQLPTFYLESKKTATSIYQNLTQHIYHSNIVQHFCQFHLIIVSVELMLLNFHVKVFVLLEMFTLIDSMRQH